MADSSDANTPGSGNISLEYGPGGRNIEILPPDPGVCEGVSQEVMAGTFKVNTRGPSDISWADQDSGAPDPSGGSNTDESYGGY